MKVQEVLLDGNKKRYMLLDKARTPIVPVRKYLDKVGKSQTNRKNYQPNNYCYCKLL